MRNALAALVLTSIFMTSVFSYETAESYSIEKMDIYAEIMPTGDIIVDEDIKYCFTGNCSNIIREFELDGADDLSIYKVFIISKDKDVVEVKRSFSGGNNTYRVVKENDSLKIITNAGNKNDIEDINIIYKLKSAVSISDKKCCLRRNFYNIYNSKKVRSGFLQIYLSDGRFSLDSMSYDIYADAEITEEFSEDFIIIRFNELKSDLGINLIIDNGYIGGDIGGDITKEGNNEVVQNKEKEAKVTSSKYKSAYIILIITMFISATLIFNKLVRKNKRG